MSKLHHESRRCYFAVYADPTIDGHVHVEAGRYGNRSLPKEMSCGDTVLLYCTATYLDYPKSIPGIGVITQIDRERGSFTYDYVPFEQAIPLGFIRFAMTTGDQVSLANIRYRALFEISSDSYGALLHGADLQ